MGWTWFAPAPATTRSTAATGTTGCTARRVATDWSAVPVRTTWTGQKARTACGGGDGDDFLVHGDWYHGGRGDDAVDLSREGPLHVDLRAFVARTANGIRRVVHVEDIIGSRYDDVLIGDADENSLDGALGDDQLYGHGGHDLLVAGPSTGVLGERPTKGTSNDQLFGGSGSDELSGRIGGVFSGGDGNDSVTVHAIGGFPGTSADGGRGLDTFVFTTNALKEVEVTIDLARERFVSDVWPRLVGWAGHVEGRIAGFENAQGWEYSDAIYGTDAANTLDGGGGHDVIRGRGGHDTCFGSRSSPNEIREVVRRLKDQGYRATRGMKSIRCEDVREHRG